MAKVGAKTASTEPAIRMTRVVSTTVRWRGPSARWPMIGVASPPASKAAVRIHWAVASDTCIASAMLGSSGAPRLVIVATTRQVTTSVAVSSGAGLADSGRDFVSTRRSGLVR